MSEQKKHIDDFFREKMGGHTEAPPSFVWKTLEQKLDSTVTPATVVSYYKWLRYGVILSLLVVLVYFIGRKMTDTSDTKQLATAEVASGGTSQSNTGVTAGNAVAGNNANTAVSGSDGANKQETTGGNATTGTQAQVTQTNRIQTQTTQQGNTVASNTSTKNDNTLAVNSSNAAATGNEQKVQPANNKMPAANTNTTATGRDREAQATNNTLIAANNNSNNQTSTVQASKAQAGNNKLVANSKGTTGGHEGNAQARNNKTLAANSTVAVTTRDRKAQAGNSNAKTVDNNETAYLAQKHANNNNTVVSRSNKSNIHAYAGKGMKVEYAQNSLKNEAGDHKAANPKNNTSNIVVDAGNYNSNATKGNTLNTANNKTAVAKNTPSQKGNNAAATAKNNTATVGNANAHNPGITAAKYQPEMVPNEVTPPINSNNAQGINPATASANNNVVNATKPVSSIEFINDLKRQEAQAAQRKLLRQPRMETGIKLGFELGFQHYSANKYVIAPYVQYGIGRFAIALQPTLKFVHNTNTNSLGDNQNYFSVTTPASYSLTSDTINATNNLRTKTYAYTEKHDSIVVGHHIDTKSYTEVELPLLLKYNITKNVSVYGGLLMNYSNTVIQIKEDKHVYSRTDDYTYSHTYPAGNQEPTIPEASSVFNYTGLAFSSYTNAGFENASSTKLRTGYMLGASYTIKDKFMVDVSVQQNLSNMNYVPNADVRGIYTQPYVRISAGYKLFKSKQKTTKYSKKH